MHRFITLILCATLLAACTTTGPGGEPLTSQEKFIADTETVLLYADIGAGFLTDPVTRAQARAAIAVVRQALELYKTAVADGADNQAALAARVTELLKSIADLNAAGKQAADSTTSAEPSTRN